jgi:hypothetical protein
VTYSFSYWPSHRSSVCCIGVRLRLRPMQQSSDLWLGQYEKHHVIILWYKLLLINFDLLAFIWPIQQTEDLYLGQYDKHHVMIPLLINKSNISRNLSLQLSKRLADSDLAVIGLTGIGPKRKISVLDWFFQYSRPRTYNYANMKNIT